MFCTQDTATVPGAVLGGKAMADSKYFEKDQLHLNATGYQHWKRIVEERIQDLL